jgi:hypothetical protein
MTATEQNRDHIEYFLENFSKEGLRYARHEAIRKINEFKNEMNLLDQEANRIKSRMEWLKNSIENYTLEFNYITSAMSEK